MKKVILLSLMLFTLFFTGCSFIENIVDIIDLTQLQPYTRNFDNSVVTALYGEQRFDEAEKIIDEYLTKYPKDLAALNEKAYVLISTGRNEEGIILLHQLLTIDPKDDCSLNNISWAYNNLRLYKISLEYINKAIEIDTNSEFQYVNKGNALYGLSRYDEAVDQYDLALNVNDKFQFAYYGKGLCYYQWEDYDIAYENFIKALEIDPYDVDYFEAVIWCGKLLEKYDEILFFCDQWIEMNPENDYGYYYKGEIYYDLGKYQKALEYYDTALQYTDYEADIYYRKCKTYLKLNNKEEAYQNLVNTLNFDEDYLYYIDLEELKELKGYQDFDQFISKWAYFH